MGGMRGRVEGEQRGGARMKTCFAITVQIYHMLYPTPAGIPRLCDCRNGWSNHCSSPASFSSTPKYFRPI